MDNKIQILTEKIYKEGVEKGNAQAETIIDNAKSQASNIIEKANRDAEAILNEATKKAAELKKNTEAELKLYAGQATEALKSEVANLITNKIVDEAVKKATDDKAYMQELILAIATEWVKKEAIVIEADDALALGLKAFFTGKAAELLTKEIEIKEVHGKGTSFTISPANGAYKVTFGEDEFAAFFKEFLRPQLIDLLF